MTYYSWGDYYTLQTQAFQNAFADMNVDYVGKSAFTCPFAIYGMTCPMSPAIYASAFASVGTFISSPSAPNVVATSPYASTFPGDFYP